MTTHTRFPLLAKVLAWLSLHLALLGLSFFLFVHWQLRLGLDSLLSGSAGERMSSFGEAVIARAGDLPLRKWNDAIKPLAEAKHVTALVFDPAGLSSLPVALPPDVMARARAAMPPPRLMPGPPPGGPAGGRPPPPRPELAPAERPPPPPPPEGDEDHRPPRPQGEAAFPPGGQAAGLGPANRPAFLMHAANGDGYWAGVLLHPPARGNPPPQPILLLIRADRLDGSGMFFDFKPWLWGGLAVLLLSLAFWTPFVWGITRYLHRLTAAADSIAAGRFQVSLPPRGHDELGNLGRTIEAMAARLEHLIAGQKRFLGDAAHELCAPLARIRTGLGILEMKLASADLTELASIEADAAELATLVEEILAFSRAGSRAPACQALAVEPLAREVIAREVPDMSVVLAIPPGLTVTADPMLLDRALRNLVRNARLHAGPHAKVTIHAVEEAGAAAITVTDDGPGVPPGELPRLFEPFYRLDRSRSRDTGGNGLGLAIVRTAIESCGGTTVASLPANGGFAVTIRLPR